MKVVTVCRFELAKGWTWMNACLWRMMYKVDIVDIRQ